MPFEILPTLFKPLKTHHASPVRTNFSLTRLLDRRRNISTYGYHQAKSLVYSKHGAIPDVLQSVNPSNFRSVLVLTLKNPSIQPGFTPTPSHRRILPSSPYALSPPLSTRPTLTKSKEPTQHSRLSQPPSRHHPPAPFPVAKPVLKSLLSAPASRLSPRAIG